MENKNKELHGVFDAKIVNGELHETKYKGESDLLVISRDTRSKNGKKGKEKKVMEFLTTVGVTNLLVILSIEYVSGLLGVLILLTGLILSIVKFNSLLKEPERYTNTKHIYNVKKGQAVRVLEKDLSDIVKLESGEVKRVYQLITDKDILENIEIKRAEILPYYLPVGFLESKVSVLIPKDKKIEDMDMEEKAVYDIGNTIPELSEGEKESLLSSLEKVYKHKTEMENIKEYDEEYIKLLEVNKGDRQRLPNLEGSRDYLRNELQNINLKINKELETNRQILDKG